jgi:hypothetical protein
MNLNNNSDAGPAEEYTNIDTHSLLSDLSYEDEVDNTTHSNDSKHFNCKGKSKLNINIRDTDRDTDRDEYINNSEILEEISICSNELANIIIDYKSACAEEKDLITKIESLKTDLEKLKKKHLDNITKLQALSEDIEVKMKLVLSQNSSIITIELLEIQKKVETLTLEQTDVEQNITILNEKMQEFNEMYIDIETRKNKLDNLKFNKETEINRREFELYNIVKEEYGNQEVENISSESLSTMSEKTKLKKIPDEDNFEEYANYLSYTIVDKINEHISSIEQNKKQLEITKRKRIECIKKYKELLQHETYLEMNLEQNIMKYKTYMSDYKGLIFNFKKDKFEKIKTRIMENGISNGIIYYGTKSKDKMMSISSYNPRFCIDDLEGNIHFFKEDWTLTKSLKLSEENRKLPMKCRVKCPSESKDCNYNLSQMKHTIFLINGYIINPCIKDW